MEILDLKGKRGLVFGLVVDCPFLDPFENCPAKKIRDLPLKDCATLIFDMEEKQLDEIISYHRQCSWARKRKLIGRSG